MTDITVESVKSQTDYIMTMQYINNMLEKVIPDPPLIPGSILVGKKYASKYNEEITKMLSSEYIDKDILKKLSEDVRVDLDYIRTDCKKRVYSDHVQDNNNMISIILDFILTLYGD